MYLCSIVIIFVIALTYYMCNINLCTICALNNQDTFVRTPAHVVMENMTSNS